MKISTILAPVILAAFLGSVAAQNVEVVLEWDPSPSSNVVGYNVYRSSQPARDVQRLNESPIQSTRYSDPSAVYGEVYWYFVTSVSATDLESVPSNQVQMDLICRGDVDFSGERTLQDVVSIQEHIVGLVVLQGNALIAADVNEDGIINVRDSIKLLNHLEGIAVLPECVR